MKAKVIRAFHDAKAGKDRKEGDEFVCSKERFEQINSAGFGKLAEAVGGSDGR